MNSSFPTSASDFYTLRDERTNRCTRVRCYQDVTCILHLSSHLADTKSAQVTFLAAANLLSRWCRRVTLVAPRIALHSDLNCETSDLVEAALKQMKDADPFGSFDAPSSAPSTHHELALCVGSEVPKLPVTRAVFVNAAGWLAGISTEKPVTFANLENGNCIGAIAAACFGVAQVFKMALDFPVSKLIRDGVFDMFGLEWTDGPNTCQTHSTDVGRLLMVGAGAVGSSATYCMRMAGLKGEITILDKDVVKISNLNRSPILGRQTFGCLKSTVVAEYLAGSALKATAHSLWWDDYISQQTRVALQFDVWLPLANEHGVRSSMQNNVPPAMVHASTTSNWGVNHGRHLPHTDDCLADRFPDNVNAADLACASGEIIEQEEQIDAALPFCSLFAGLLVAAELLRLQLPIDPPVPNFALIDWKGTLDTVQKWDMLPKPGCICREQDQSVHERFNKATRLWPKFRFCNGSHQSRRRTNC